MPSASMSESEILSVIQSAHIAASDLSRAALMTSYPLCLSLQRAAKKMEEALRKEGL